MAVESPCSHGRSRLCLPRQPTLLLAPLRAVLVCSLSARVLCSTSSHGARCSSVGRAVEHARSVLPISQCFDSAQLVSYFLLISVSSRLAWPEFPSRRRSGQVSSFVVVLCVQQLRVYVAPALLSTSLAVAQLASSSCRVVCRYSLPAGLAVDHVQVIVRLLASHLFNKTPKSIDCRRTPAIRGCLRHLRQLARPTSPYMSLSRIVVEPGEPRSSLLDLIEPRIPDFRQK
jgi:hypothetical protein